MASTQFDIVPGDDADPSAGLASGIFAAPWLLEGASHGC